MGSTHNAGKIQFWTSASPAPTIVNMLKDNPELYRGLNYPWGRKVSPLPGVPEKIADGVYWLRIPMPISLDHINIWLLEDGDGWTIVDTCLDLPDARTQWEQLFRLEFSKVRLRMCCYSM